MPYAWFLASCSMGSLLSWLFLDLVFPSVLLLWIHWIHSLRIVRILPLESVVSLISRVSPPLNYGIACLAYLNPGIACLASWSSDWLDALWVSLSGVQSSMTFVRLNVIGHCWGGTFNCPASTCWLIDCALAQVSPTPPKHVAIA